MIGSFKFDFYILKSNSMSSYIQFFLKKIGFTNNYITEYLIFFAQISFYDKTLR